MLNQKEVFQTFIGRKAALYGLGTETEKALRELGDKFDIIGLLDSFKESGELYGKKILSVRQAVDMGVSLIIVVARPGSCKAIAKRMKETCLQNQIRLFDVRGKDLLVANKAAYDFRHLSGITRAELIREAMKAEIISFDLFDTLVTRAALSYTDIFDLMEYQIRKRGWKIPDFSGRRLSAEKELAKTGAPTLKEIYENVLRELKDSSDDLLGELTDKESLDTLSEELADMEWKLDFSMMVPRTEVCDVLNHIAQSGKTVYIVTDTYYKKEQIIKILQKYGVNGYKDIIASCEYHTGKRQKLFGRFREVCRGMECLHIGDDLAADIEAASGYGMKSIRLYSSVDLFDELGSLGLDSCVESLADRVKVGSFIARLFNSPFQFEHIDRMVGIRGAYNVGYLLCAPIICDFLLWFYENVKRRGIRNIWFSARDGYLLQKLYQMMKDMDGVYSKEAGTKDTGKDVESEYFLTSRIAAVRAGMEEASDVDYVDSMKFSGTVEENLKVRFGLDIWEPEGIGDRGSGLIGYKNEILESAKRKRDMYIKYVNTLNQQEGETAFFDFVAKGTTQLYVQKITGRRLQGFYFLQLEPEFMSDKGLNIEPFYKVSDRDNSAIFDDYYILETILTAPHPMIVEFDNEGRPVFAEETRSEQNIRCVMKVQEGILDYFSGYLRRIPKEMRNVNRALDEKMLRLVHEIKIQDPEFRSLTVEDPFFNRMTEIEDVL